MNINKHSLQLKASVRAVITLFLKLPGNDRINHIISRIEKLNDMEAGRCMEWVMQHFDKRHRNIQSIFKQNFQKLNELADNALSQLATKKKLLLGAFFTKEYSIQSAALFNPSIVPHPDQQGLKSGELRFLMSLRATGEGHISSIVFQTGIVDEDGSIILDPPTGYYKCLQKNEDATYNKEFLRSRAAIISGFDFRVIDWLPESFSASSANLVFKGIAYPQKFIVDSISAMQEMLDSNYELKGSPSIPLNEKVIFPSANAESMGMEDLRLVKFEHEGESVYYGTYTAYDGKQIRTKLIETRDFNDFVVRTLYGIGISDKGMALFPEKVNGKFVMISRQGGENISIMFSNDLYFWEKSELLMEPVYPWELLQIGNCGSPIKTKEGWLLLTHGVGAMRTYVISAILLDLHEPSRIIGRLDKPLLAADESEREGYVPNVVYTCGFMQHHNLLIIPYAISDSATCFASINLDELLLEFK